MKAPAISVILPYFNVQQTLVRCIQSILKQTFEDFELILVDNNSTDDSAQIAGSFSKTDHRIKLVSESRQGVAFASNRGFQLAQGRFLARMDADDEMRPNRLEVQLAHLQSDEQVDLIGGQVAYQGPEENTGFRHYVDWSNRLLSPDDLFMNRFVELPMVNPTFMFRRSSWVKYGSYRDGDFPEDYELFLRWMDQGARVSKVPEVVLDWHDLPERLTRTHPHYEEEAFFKIKALYLSKWLKQNLEKKSIWAWGAGRVSRRRSAYILYHGLKIAGYIDVVPKNLTLPCVHFEDIPPPGKQFILSYVGNRGKRDEIRQFLQSRGYVEGVDFILGS